MQFYQELQNKNTTGIGSAASFSDDEDATQMFSSTSASRGRKGASGSLRSSHDASDVGKSKASTRGRGRGRGRGRCGGSANLKQTTLDASLGFRRSARFACSLIIISSNHVSVE